MRGIILNNRLRRLAELRHLIDTATETSANEEFQKEYFLLSAAILENFGLPDIEKYKKYFSFDKAVTETEINNRISLLKTAAQDYLLSPAGVTNKCLTMP